MEIALSSMLKEFLSKVFQELRMLGNFLMEELAIVVFVGVLLCAIPCGVLGVSVSCMMAYEEGGAPAVFSSLECPQWVQSAGYSENSTRNCQFAMLQGRREYQEDRVTCNLDMKLPFSGDGGPQETTVGIAAIFDGHGGDKASEMASRKLLNYFSMHAVLAAYRQALPSNKENREKHKVERMDHNSLLPILEEALVRTIQDIDSEFSKEALDKGYISGSTAIIVLLMNGRFLVTNVGDSKALLCSEKLPSHSDTEGTASEEFYAEQLTRDHHPDRADEKARIQSAGGFVSERGIPRVNGILAVSRAIGDVYLKRYGVTADPEVTGWRAFTRENSHLVIASDGIFETLTPQNVCNLVHDKAPKFSSKQVSSSSLADWIIHHAFRRGSTDNLSAIVISDL